MCFAMRNERGRGRHHSAVLLVLGISLAGVAWSSDTPPERGLQEVRHDRVRLHGGFWGPRQELHHEVTIPHALDCLERAGHVTNFDKAAGVFEGPLQGHHAFDSDLHKALEGALYSLRHRDDPVLRERVEGLVDRIVAAQQEDGFLISYYIVRDREKRWEDLRLEHQLYNAGHFFEMAVEHQRLGGSDMALGAARRFADHIDGVFGPGKRYDVGGHEEVELALVKLYRATGERRYLELARFFLDERGHAHGSAREPFDFDTMTPAPDSFDHLPAEERRRARWRARLRLRNGRMQDHMPLVEQEEAVGHAVRAGYVYAAMADIARFMDAPEYGRALGRIWRDVVARKMYITGSVGTAQYGDEGFGDPYLLPNKTYCESCANIAHVLWQHRMNLLEGRARYADVMELALYNGAIAGIALSGDGFFYQNPLASEGARRSSWIGLACCPTNLTRLIPQVGGFMYAQRGERLYVNLYAEGEASIRIDEGTTVRVEQRTEYPWSGRVLLTITPERPLTFDLCLRIPGWARGRPVPSDLYRFADPEVAPIALRVAGRAIEVTPQEDGYVHLRRAWAAGDDVELDLPLPIRRVLAHEKVEEDRGKVALMRGPVVFCLEAVDNPETEVSSAVLARDAVLHAEHRAELLGGVIVLRGAGLQAVPYYAWANREQGAMSVWIDEAADDLSEQAGEGPVQVFVLAGQSNMQGQGVVDMDDPRDYNGGKGNLEHVMEHSPLASQYAHLKDAQGKWTVRDDVWVRHATEKRGLLTGNLTIGFTGYGGRTHIGPELQIGHVLGERLENQVLLVKTAWGGKSLHRDFRPPRSGGEVGPYYTRMLREVQEALDRLESDFPAYDGSGYEIAGFIWLQGWNDMFEEGAVEAYEQNLVDLIQDVRAAWGVPDLPVVIGELGNGGADAGEKMLALRKAQAAAAARPELAGSVTFVSTSAFARPADESPNRTHGHHWFGNAESYFLIGNALGEGMAELLAGQEGAPK